jgi:hypothetical protein
VSRSTRQRHNEQSIRSHVPDLFIVGCAADRLSYIFLQLIVKENLRYWAPPWPRPWAVAHGCHGSAPALALLERNGERAESGLSTHNRAV